MDKQRLIHKLIAEEFARCSQLYDAMSSKMKSLSKGCLVKRGERHYHVIRKDGKQQFIPIDDPVIIHQLKTRRYIKESLPILRQKTKTCRSFLDNDVLFDPIQIEGALPVQYGDLNDIDIFLENDINIAEWVNEKYNTNPMPISIPHYTANGLKVRSKAEELIAGKLEEAGLPFRYEPELKLGQRKVYPDFAVLLTAIRRIIYWEHLGLIDDPQYVLSNLHKLEEYAKYGIYLGFNLMITYETRDRPLTTPDVNRKIKDLIKLNNAAA